MNMMVGFAVIAASVFLCFAEAPAQMIGIQAEDLWERMVNTVRLRGPSLMIGFAMGETSDEVTEWQTEISSHAQITL